MTEVKRIILVDDDAIFLVIAKAMMKKIFPEATCVTCGNGEEALKMLKNTRPDIMFLDINMPIMGGWELLKNLEHDFSNIQFPIYVTTSSIDPEDYREAQEHPFVSGFIEKPLNKDSIAKLVLQP